MTNEEFAQHMKAFARCIRDPYISTWINSGAEVYAGRPDPIMRHERRKAPDGMCVHHISLEDECPECEESYGTNRCISL